MRTMLGMKAGWRGLELLLWVASVGLSEWLALDTSAPWQARDSLEWHQEGLSRTLSWEQQAQWGELWSRHHGTNPGDSLSGLKQVSTSLWTSKVLSTSSSPLLAFLGPGSPKTIFYNCYLFFSSLGLQLQGLAEPLLHLPWNLAWPVVRRASGSQSVGW